MQRIPIKYAAPGMKLEKEAVTPEGQVLCGPDSELTAELIERLKKQGVTVLTVQGRPVVLPGDKSLGTRLKELEHRFSKVNNDPVLKAIKKLIAKFWIVQEKGPEAVASAQKNGGQN